MINNIIGRSPVIAAVQNDEQFEVALHSLVDTVFFLYPDIMNLHDIVQRAHGCGKRLLIHLDLTAGLGKDASGIAFAAEAGVDGIISTRVGLIKLAKEHGLLTVQRFFIVDSHSIDTTVDSLKNSKADMIELMPGIAPKIIERIGGIVNVPIIAGGLIETKQEVKVALQSGACAISTGAQALWSTEARP